MGATKSKFHVFDLHPTLTVTDPAFSMGVLILEWGTNLWHNFCRKLHENEKKKRLKGGARPSHPEICQCSLNLLEVLDLLLSKPVMQGVLITLIK